MKQENSNKKEYKKGMGVLGWSGVGEWAYCFFVLSQPHEDGRRAPVLDISGRYDKRVVCNIQDLQRIQLAQLPGQLCHHIVRHVYLHNRNQLAWITNIRLALS